MGQIFSVKKHNKDLPHTGLITIRIEVFPENPDGECSGETVHHTHMVEVVRENNFEDCIKMSEFKAREMLDELSNKR